MRSACAFSYFWKIRLCSKYRMTNRRAIECHRSTRSLSPQFKSALDAGRRPIRATIQKWWIHGRLVDWSGRANCVVGWRFFIFSRWRCVRFVCQRVRQRVPEKQLTMTARLSEPTRRGIMRNNASARRRRLTKNDARTRITLATTRYTWAAAAHGSRGAVLASVFLAVVVVVVGLSLTFKWGLVGAAKPIRRLLAAADNKMPRKSVHIPTVPV